MISPQFITTLALSTCVGVLSAFMAFRRGKNPYLWFFIGALFGLLGIFALFLPSFQKKKPRAMGPLFKTSIVGPINKFWYYLDESHKQVGPVSLYALKKAWEGKQIHEKTFVWHEELEDWKMLENFLQKEPLA